MNLLLTNLRLSFKKMMNRIIGYLYPENIISLIMNKRNLIFKTLKIYQVLRFKIKFIKRVSCSPPGSHCKSIIILNRNLVNK